MSKLQIFRNTSCHKGDTFRELLTMWEESGYCDLIESDDRFCWVNKINDILLYEYARFDFIPESWNCGLFSNSQMKFNHCHPWIFWARHPRKLEESIRNGIIDFDYRETKSIFLGKIENHIQFENRVKHDWSSCIEMFSMPIVMGNVSHYIFTQDEYLEKVKRSKFGLVLPGYGPKCNREIEYLGLGTVPIYTEGCNIDFHDPLIEGVHYLFAKTPEDVLDIVGRISKKEWNELSTQGREWYNKNCSQTPSLEEHRLLIS